MANPENSFINDARIVATALVDDAVQSEYQGDYGMHEYLNKCICCCAEYPPEETFKHETTCPVLVAQDLLT